MLKDCIKHIIELIKSEFEDFVKVDIYRNEFDIQSEWNPQFPCCLIRVDSYYPEEYNESHQGVSYTGDLSLFVGIKTSSGKDGLELSEDVFHYFNNLIEENYGYIIKELLYVENKYGVEVYGIRISIHFKKLS
ncbi:MAG: hypothetical protein FJ216_10125 [Ignavibacteria bacterium]|nr:hypothetical protein [Ignavibacteria bacterium]